jgi:two-component system chemotaxis sensor kinase CheA
VSSPFAHLLEDFLADAGSTLERILEDAEALVSPSGTVDGDVLLRIRRDIHTLKGNASMMDLDAVVAVAHAMEDLCVRIESGDTGLVGRIVEGCDQIVSMLGRLRDSGGAKPEPTRPISNRPRVDESVRVDFLALERLGNLAAEATMLARSVAGAMRGRDTQLEEDLSSLSTALRVLRDRLAEMRLVPIGRLFRRFEPYVREAARVRDADVRLSTSGSDTLIDKTLIDRLHEPLLHLVRNAIAHGVETPSERVAAGKPAHATIALGARISQGRALVTVSDDGRGLQTAAIRARARLLGVDVEGLGGPDVLRLVFLPGLSTAASVSEIAGRGVGLDAVRAALTSAGGDIDVRSAEGFGTTFELSLPVAAAVVRGILVEVNGETLVAPFDGLETARPFEPGSVKRIDGIDVVPEGAGLLPVIDGGSLLGDADARGTGRRMCVVLQAGQRRRGLLVDRVLEPGEFVLRRLDLRLQVSRSFGGVVVLGNGRVALVVDPHAAMGAVPS